jgi:hypothetical protein
MKNYDDIINLVHPDPKNHTRMPRENRAAQFGAFRALAGHEDAVAETARFTDEEIKLDEYHLSELDHRLAQILRMQDAKPTVRVLYFVPDERKKGGHYLVKEGTIKKVDFFERLLVFDNGEEILLNHIKDIKVQKNG